MDQVPDRPAGETEAEIDVIDISSIDPAALAALPESALVAALRRAAGEYCSGPDRIGRHVDTPSG